MAGETAAQRVIRCYHCRGELAVPECARSATCPLCHRGLVLEDLCVKDATGSGKLLTCGRVFIEKKARAIVKTVQAGEGIEVKGLLEASVASGGPVVVAKGARLRGECQATSLWIDPGGVVENVYFRIGPAPATA